LEQFPRNTRARAREGRPRVLKSSGCGITKGRAASRSGCWSEKNGPPVRAPNFGTRPIETLGHQLKGDVRLTYELTGFVYALDVPLASQRRVTGHGTGISPDSPDYCTDFRSSPESELRSDVATCPKSAIGGRHRPPIALATVSCPTPEPPVL